MYVIALKACTFLKKWCRPEELNPQPTDYKSVALPIELDRHFYKCCYYIGAYIKGPLHLLDYSKKLYASRLLAVNSVKALLVALPIELDRYCLVYIIKNNRCCSYLIQKILCAPRSLLYYLMKQYILFLLQSGGGCRVRTCDPLLVRQVLSQLS